RHAALDGAARWQGEEDGRTPADLRLHPDPPAMPLDDLLADRQTDAGSWVRTAVVQALEDDEDPLKILRLDADAVVAHAEDPVPIAGARRDVQQRLAVCGA